MEILRERNFTMSPIVVTFILGFTTLLLMLWYSCRKQNYWKTRGIPYARTVPFLGSTLDNFKQPFQDTELERYQKYGRLYGHFEGNNPVLSVGDPEMLRNILVKDFQTFTGRRRFELGDPIADKMVQTLQGEDWKRVRTIITPTFTTGKIKRMLNIFKECSETVVQNLREAAEQDKTINAKSLYGAFTMDIIASSAFSTKIDSHNDPNNQFVRYAKAAFAGGVTWKFILLTIAPKLVKKLRMSLFPKDGLEFFKKVTIQIMEERRRTGKKRNDFLQLLMDTASEVADGGESGVNEKDDIVENYGKEENEIFKSNAYIKKSLSRDELIAQCVIFFLAGYETTASTLSFVSYCLALNSEVQEKLIQELDDALRKNGELTYEAIQSMKYLDNVIAETMRIYPPITRLERVADEDYKLADTGLTLPKGMIITIPTYAMHRDPDFFPDPEKFDPDRFCPEERAKRDQYTYLPFGHGPRNCIGLRFALMEIKVCLAHVFSNFRIKRCPETKVPLEWNTGIGMLQPKNISFKVEVRNDTMKTL